MIGATLHPRKKGGPTYRVTGSVGGGWIVARVDAFEPPRTLAAGELESFTVGEQLVDPPDHSPAALADREALGWQVLGRAQTPTVADLAEDGASGPALVRVLGPGGGYSDLDAAFGELRGGTPSDVLAEDVFAVEAPGDDNEQARETAATNVARAIIADAEKREQAQRGDLNMHPAVFRRVRELLGKNEDDR